MEQEKPRPKPRTKRYEKSTEHVEINDSTRQELINSNQRLLPGVNDLLHEVRQLKQQLSDVREERDEFKEEVTFLKYQLAYRAQVQDLQKSMSDKPAAKTTKQQNGKKQQKSVRFSSNISINCTSPVRTKRDPDDSSDMSDNDVSHTLDDSFTSAEWEEFRKLKAEREELEDVLYDFYHDAKMANARERVLVGNIDSDPSESTSSLICRVLVNYEKLNEEKHILEEEKAKLDEDKLQLCNSMAKLREQLHDAVDSNIEEIEDLNRENEELRYQLNEKVSALNSSLIQTRETSLTGLRMLSELARTSTLDRVEQRIKRDILIAENDLKTAKNLANKPKEEKDSKFKRSKALPSTFRESTPETIERGGLLQELKTCKELQESQRKQIQKILEEKLDLETQLSELKRQNVVLRTERRSNIKTKSKHVQAQLGGQETGDSTGQVADNSDVLLRKCKDLEQKLESVKKEKLTVEEEKACLLMSLDANIEKKDAVEEQLKALQDKVEKIEKDKKNAKGSLSETDGALRAAYKKDLSEVKMGIEKLRLQEQDKQIIMLKRENDSVKEKLKKSEDMLKTLQNCLKELTDEKHDLLDSIEELNEEKAELEGARMKMETELKGARREKFAVEEVSDIRKKEEKLVGDIEASKAKLSQLDLKMVEVLAMFDTEEDSAQSKTKTDSPKGVEEMIGSLLLTVDNLKRTVSTFKATYDKTNVESLQMKDQLQTINDEKSKQQQKIDALNEKIKDLTTSLEWSSKDRKSYESRMSKELEKMRGAKEALEKSFSVARRREGELERQLKDVQKARDELQTTFNELTAKHDEATSLLSEARSEAEEARSTNEVLTKELDQLREDLEGAVEDRDELLELLDRIVCENGGSEEDRFGLGQKVERIRDKSRSEEALDDVSSNSASPVKPVIERYLASSQATVECSTSDENVFGSSSAEEGRPDRPVDEIVEENQRLKEMVEKILNDQKKFEAALSSFSEVNAEIKEDLKESIKQTKQIQIQREPEESHNRTMESPGHDVVDFGGVRGPSDIARVTEENEELRKLHEAMVDTNETLNVHIQRLHEEKARTRKLKSTWHEVTRKNASLEAKIKDLTKEKSGLEREILSLEEKVRKIQKESDRAMKEKLELETIFEESKSRVSELKMHVDSLTEINKDLRETNEFVAKSSKEAEAKLMELDRDMDDAESANSAFEQANTRLHKQVVEIETELETSRAESKKHSKRIEELEECIQSNGNELKILRKTAGKLSELEEKAGKCDTLENENEALKETVSEHQASLEESETKIARLKKEIENSQRYVKVVSQENDSLRDTISDWEASKARKHQASQYSAPRAENMEMHRNNSPVTATRESSLQAEPAEGSGKSVNTSEAMQVEMDALNKHLKSLMAEKRELELTAETLSQENNEFKDESIKLLTNYDMLSKELERKEADISKFTEEKEELNAKVETYEKSCDKFEAENRSLKSNSERLEQDNSAMRSSLGITVDEERTLGEKLKTLAELWKPTDNTSSKRKSKSKDTKHEEQKARKSAAEAGALAAAKPDLIRHSKDASSDDEAKYNNEYFGLEANGQSTDVHELVKGVSNERAMLTSHCEHVARVFHEMVSRDGDLRKQLEEATAKKGKKESKDATRVALEKAKQHQSKLEEELGEEKSKVQELADEKRKSEEETAVMKEKCDKLQAVFRALVLVMNDKKTERNGRPPSDSDQGTTGVLDYIKNIKAKYTGLITENENLETKVESLQKEIDELRAKEKAKVPTPRSGNENDPVYLKALLEEKERILNELLLTSARDKRRFVEKLQEVYDEFDHVKTQLGDEVKKQQKSSPKSSVVLDKVYKEFVESVTHTETFVQSVVHERRVTVVADTSSEPDANLELAKENEELIGRINAIKSSRRRETKTLKDEITKITQEKEEGIKEMEERLKTEVEAMKMTCDKTIKEKEDAVTEVQNELEQLKADIKKLKSESEETQEKLMNEHRLVVEQLEGKLKTIQADLDKMTGEKKSSEAKIVEMSKTHAAEMKEKAHLSESEISHVRANWAAAERKLRTLTDEKTKIETELGQTKDKMVKNEDSFSEEREKLQTKISTLEEAFKKKELDNLERTQGRITNFQRSLDELAQKNKQLENARENTEDELDLLKHENMRLQRDLRTLQDQRRVIVSSKEQPRRIESTPSPTPVTHAQERERVKVLSAVQHSSIEIPRLVSPLESAGPSFPAFQGDRRAVKVREAQTAVVHKGRVQESGVRRPSDHRDAVCDELGAMFRQLNNEPDWSVETTQKPPRHAVIHARPVQKTAQGTQLESTEPQKPQPEWEPKRQERPRTLGKEPPPARRAPPTTRQQDTPSPTVRVTSQPYPHKVGYIKDEESYKRGGAHVTRQRDTPSPTVAVTSQPYPHKMGYTKDEDSHKRTTGAPLPAPKPVRNQQSRNAKPATGQRLSNSSDKSRQSTEVHRVPAEKPADMIRTYNRGGRRPSVGSDDVFVSEHALTLTSHGAKNSDFYRSRSLDNLVDASDDRTKGGWGQNNDHASRRNPPKAKLPKTFSGPHNLESATRGRGPQAGMTSPQADRKVKKVAPLKGMEYVIFQHQL